MATREGVNVSVPGTEIRRLVVARAKAIRDQANDLDQRMRGESESVNALFRKARAFEFAANYVRPSDRYLLTVADLEFLGV